MFSRLPSLLPTAPSVEYVASRQRPFKREVYDACDVSSRGFIAQVRTFGVFSGRLPPAPIVFFTIQSARRLDASPRRSLAHLVRDLPVDMQCLLGPCVATYYARCLPVNVVATASI